MDVDNGPEWEDLRDADNEDDGVQIRDLMGLRYGVMAVYLLISHSLLRSFQRPIPGRGQENLGTASAASGGKLGQGPASARDRLYALEISASASSGRPAT